MEKVTLKLNKAQIFTIGNSMILLLREDFGSIPVKLGYTLRKNAEKFIALGTEINQKRLEICEKYGKLNQEEQLYQLLPEYQEIGNEELNKLSNEEVEIEITLIPIELFDGVNMTSEQISAISFMIGE